MEFFPSKYCGHISLFFLSLPKDIFSLLLERKKRREEERKRNIDERGNHQLAATHTPAQTANLRRVP